MDVIEGESAIPLAAGTTTRIDSLAGSVEVGAIEDGYGARLELTTTPCPSLWSLEGFGLSRDEFERVAASLVSITEGFAIWPQDTAQAAADRGRVEAGQAWLQDGEAAVLQFAREVLGWNEALVIDSEPSEDGRFGGNYSVERDRGGPTISVTAAPLVDALYNGPHWYVYRVGSATVGPSVQIAAGSAFIHLDTERAHSQAELHLGHGEHEVPVVRAATADFEVDLNYEIDTTGHVLVIWRDERGLAVDAWGAALPARTTTSSPVDSGTSSASPEEQRALEEQRRAEAAAAEAQRRACAAMPDTGVNVDRYVLTQIPEGFVQAGPVETTSSGFVDMGGSSEATVRFVDGSGRTIDFTVVGRANWGDVDASVHAGVQTMRVETDVCPSASSAGIRSAVWNVSETPDRIAATGDGFEWGFTSVVGTGGVSRDELLRLLRGLRT